MQAKCSICGADARKQFTEVVGGRRRTTPLCLDCFEKQGYASPPPRPAQPPQIEIKLQAQVLGSGLPATTLRCPDCGMRLVEFRKTGRVGCARCYEVFRKHLLPLLKRVHGAIGHEGARPAGAERGGNLARLREDLRRAIEAEDFEQAARLRDRIGSSGRKARRPEGEDRG